ncbi:MAG: response regulator [Gammaproteobacteria bacterium]|nr:response regulator [Gammaproteobacteria bacterium]
MATQEFDFATGKVVDVACRQLMVLSGCEETSERVETYARGNRYKFLGKSADLRQALELVRKFKRGLFFLDADTQGVDALSLIKVLTDKAPLFKVILMSQSPTKALLSEGREAGAAGFLAKPLKIDVMEKTIKQIT